MNNHKVAVYGSLRKGLYNHCVLHGAKYLTTANTKFPANLRDLGSFPYVHTTDTEDTDNPVVVEIYEVTDSGLQRLDDLEGYPSFYNRSQFEFSDGTKAWMYHIEDKNNKQPLVESGDWVRYCEAL